MIKQIRLFVYVPDQGENEHLSDKELAVKLLDVIDRPFSNIEPLDISITDASEYDNVRLAEERRECMNRILEYQA